MDRRGFLGALAALGILPALPKEEGRGLEYVDDVGPFPAEEFGRILADTEAGYVILSGERYGLVSASVTMPYKDRLTSWSDTHAAFVKDPGGPTDPADILLEVYGYADGPWQDDGRELRVVWPGRPTLVFPRAYWRASTVLAPPGHTVTTRLVFTAPEANFLL